MENMKKPKVILIAGPTGVGKTAASVELAKMLDTEIISCDSMQIYKGMDIGTAKVTVDEAQGIKHHMTDIVDPDQSFSVCDYVKMASPIIGELDSRGKVALVVGGTGLYADSLLKGIEFRDDASSDEAYRDSMTRLASEKGCEYVHSLLREADPVSADAIHPNNIKRVIRALEHYHTTGERISEHNLKTKELPEPYDSVRIYFTRSRENLYKRIDQRVDIMIRDGLYEEVRYLMEKGIDQSTTAMQAIGYKEMAEAVRGNISVEEAAELIKKGTRHYAKRQLTWFKRDKDGIWLNLDEISTPLEAAEKCLEIAERSRA